MQNSSKKSLKLKFSIFLCLVLTISLFSFFLGFFSGSIRLNFFQGANEKKSLENENGRKLTNLYLDWGLELRSYKPDKERILENRLNLAKVKIIIITNNPLDPNLLNPIRKIQKEKRITIYLFGPREILEKTQLDKDLRISKYGYEISKESPYTFVSIDSRILIDCSRNFWIWETTDKRIIKEFQNWIEFISKNSSFVN